MSRSCLLLLVVAFAVPVTAQDDAYLKDFEFLRRSVLADAAAIASKGIDWGAACDRLRPEFVTCESDLEHLRNVMRLLAVLRDSHTGVTRSAVPWKELPGKFDGLFGGGLWFGWDGGRFVVRGIMDGHPLEKVIPLGSVLVAIEGVPVQIAMAREQRRIETFAGQSSEHSLYASLGNRLLPFGERDEIRVLLMTPEAKVIETPVRRWGPGGKAYYPSEAQLPPGIRREEGACAGMLALPWSDGVGYLRITGGMNDATVAAFHRAFDTLRGMKALLLDGRGMGGGGDLSAWAMAGRLFARPVANGRNGRIAPSGSWQFEGPVVMLQDELEVSSAETFTWALSETERVISVGRPTGGWGIIPRSYQCPSGLCSVRIGVTDRPTPIRGIRTEGIGWPPDLLVPLGPEFCAQDDPDRELGLEVLRVLHAGVKRRSALKLFQRLLAGDVAGFRRQARTLVKKVPGWKPEVLARHFERDLDATLAMETALLTKDEVPLADHRGAARRAEALLGVATTARRSSAATRLKSLVAKGKKEAAAQEALTVLLQAGEPVPEKALDAYLRRHGKTAVGRWARKNL